MLYNRRIAWAGNPSEARQSETPEPIVERASSKLQIPAVSGLYAATKPKARSTMGFVLSGPIPSLCAVRRWHRPYKPLTRASQRGRGGLRIEPGGDAKNGPFGSWRLSLFNAMRRHGSGKHTKARAVSLRYGSALLKQSPRSIRVKEMKVTDDQFRFEWYSGTGKGGQHRNKHQNCCRCIHGPTGIMANGTESRSREDNKRAALEVCKARIAAKFRQDKERFLAGNERIRTYNEADNRVYDHASGIALSWDVVMVKNEFDAVIVGRAQAVR